MPNLPEFENEYYKMEFTFDEIKRCEIFCLKSLGYKLNYFTAYHFINYFIIHGYIYSDEVINPNYKIKDKYLANNDNNGKI